MSKYTARNSHDKSQTARWRTRQVRQERPGFGYSGSPGVNQHQRDIFGDCPVCRGDRCQTCKRQGFTYREWMMPEDDS